MPSEIKTKNLGLNQWQGNEYLKREDLNEDNEKIDDAMGQVNEKIKANADNITTLKNKKNIIIKTIVIDKKNYERVHFDDLTETWFRYFYQDSDISIADVVDINFRDRDIINGYTSSVLSNTRSADSKVYFYSDKELLLNLEATMIIQKAVI